MVNVKKRKGRVVIDSDSEDSASDDNLDQVGVKSVFCFPSKLFEVKLMYANRLRCCVWPRFEAESGARVIYNHRLVSH